MAFQQAGSDVSSLQKKDGIHKGQKPGRSKYCICVKNALKLFKKLKQKSEHLEIKILPEVTPQTPIKTKRGTDGEGKSVSIGSAKGRREGMGRGGYARWQSKKVPTLMRMRYIATYRSILHYDH